jgi:hypothetical protein
MTQTNIVSGRRQSQRRKLCAHLPTHAQTSQKMTNEPTKKDDLGRNGCVSVNGPPCAEDLSVLCNGLVPVRALVSVAPKQPPQLAQQVSLLKNN